MRSSWWKSTAAWLSSSSQESYGGFTTGRECRFIPLFQALPCENRHPTRGAAFERDGELAVSLDPANLPYSSAKDNQPGFDLELARALAQRLHVKLRVEWLDVQHETAVGELLEHKCDLVFGEAVAANVVADDEALTGKLLYSRSYYRTGYVLVQRKNGPHAQSLVELKGAKSQRLGTEAGSVADYTLRQRGYLRRLYRNQLATLKALNDGDIDHAYVWANVGWTLHTTPDWNLELTPTFVPEEHWDIAIAMGRGDDELKRQVDAALDTLIMDGTVARVLAHYHMPYYAPELDPEHNQQGSAGETMLTESRTEVRSPKCKRYKYPSTLTRGWPGCVSR